MAGNSESEARNPKPDFHEKEVTQIFEFWFSNFKFPSGGTPGNVALTDLRALKLRHKNTYRSGVYGLGSFHFKLCI